MAENSDSLRDTLVASMEEHGVPTESEGLAALEPAAAVAAPAAAEPAADGRVRDASGRFAEKPVNAAPPEPPPSSAAASPSSAAPAVAAPDTTLAKPASWKGGEVEQKWAELPPAVQQEIHRREQDYQKGITRAQRAAEEVRPLNDAIAPFRENMQRYGIDAPSLVSNMMSAHQTMSLGSGQQKLDTFANLAKDYGIPLQILYDANARNQWLAQTHAQQPVQQAAPVTAQSVSALVETALLQKTVNQEIAAMKADTANYPYFQYLRPTIAKIMEDGDAETLGDAYKLAMEAPEHALLSRALPQQPATSQQPATAAVRAQVARRNAVSPKSSTPGPAVGNPKMALRDTIAAAVEQHAGGARV